MTSGAGQTSTGAGADFVVVANRLPVDLVIDRDGTEHWKASPGGLVTALESILKANDGAWVGWPGVPDAAPEPFDTDGIRLHSVTLSAQDVELYYEGFSNATLWPLFHDVVVPAEYHREWWNAYREINTRFAEATAEAAAEGATVWVQDYQLLLVPCLLRELRPDLTIGFFLHIPFPPVELFMQLPWRTELVEGMLGADLVGFHLPGGADNFRILANRLRGYPSVRLRSTRGRASEIRVDDRMVRVGAFPISIDSAAVDATARTRETQARAARLREELGSPRVLMLGVDRLDYTKGIDVRLRALEELFEEGRLEPADVTLLQLATPSRERVEQYQIMRSRIEESVGRINGTFGEIGHPVVTYIHRPVPKTELAAFYAAADVMLVTPVRDGMNLVAKEYVASCTDGEGALVLSEFAGAAAELRQAYLCNPHDLDGVKDAIMAAVDDNPDDRRRRMRSLRRQVLSNDVHAWARRFFNTLDATSDD
ncbi:trehalose-6-phosphate synthase [Dietzia maris]|uniref:alpha,alpha-trehalose-phosphate synthase (ADP-forming) n=1 Tax=Dietzia maris TaxID=37915 RepID=A0AAE4QYX0_9ACTN|nr:trehalose-6-phosphate synthase [Dietzia maris]MDV6299748.1 trehalose-6-phosphate synthase [Dietzia maris]